jgi:hypothetical protein
MDHRFLETNSYFRSRVNPNADPTAPNAFPFQPLQGNICELHSSTPSQNERDCIGLVLDNERRYYRIDACDRTSCPEIKQAKEWVTLESFLSADESRYNPEGLDRDERASLAVNLAFSVLELYGTPWLSETWSKASIRFIRRSTISEPWVIISTVSPKETPKTKTGPNPYLLGLGIILLELVWNKSFEKWLQEAHEDTNEDITSPKSKLWLGNKWLEQAKYHKLVSNEYADAVDRCFRGVCTPFVLNETLETPEFRKAVYSQIFLPLEKEYSSRTNTFYAIEE